MPLMKKVKYLNLRSNDSLLAEYQALRSKLATLPDNLPNTTAKNTLGKDFIIIFDVFLYFTERDFFYPWGIELGT